MRHIKYRIALSSSEYRLLMHCLLDFRNRLLGKGRYTEAVDELIIKFSK